MKEEEKKKKALARQFKKWVKGLAKANPDYAFDALRLHRYICGPNWNAPGADYAHYRDLISGYGSELLEFFEMLRCMPENVAVPSYADMLRAAGCREVHDDKALKHAESIGVYEFRVNGRYMEYWTFSGKTEGWYFVRYDLDMEEEVFRGANIPFVEDAIPAFLLSDTGAALYNYMEG